MRHFFVSYHHRSSVGFLEQMRQRLNDPNVKDYGFRQVDLGENSKYTISRSIQNRIWASSVTVVLVGDQTAGSDWVDWEIWYSLRSLKAIGPSRRAFKPKGLLAVFLPVPNPNIPERLKQNLESGYALSMEWNELESDFYPRLEQAFDNREKKQLIRNELPPKINPQETWGRIESWLGLSF